MVDPLAPGPLELEEEEFDDIRPWLSQKWSQTVSTITLLFTTGVLAREHPELDPSKMIGYEGVSDWEKRDIVYHDEENAKARPPIDKIFQDLYPKWEAFLKEFTYIGELPWEQDPRLNSSDKPSKKASYPFALPFEPSEIFAGYVTTFQKEYPKHTKHFHIGIYVLEEEGTPFKADIIVAEFIQASNEWMQFSWESDAQEVFDLIQLQVEQRCFPRRLQQQFDFLDYFV